MSVFLSSSLILVSLWSFLEVARSLCVIPRFRLFAWSTPLYTLPLPRRVTLLVVWRRQRSKAEMHTVRRLVKLLLILRLLRLLLIGFYKLWQRHKESYQCSCRWLGWLYCLGKRSREKQNFVKHIPICHFTVFVRSQTRFKFVLKLQTFKRGIFLRRSFSRVWLRL